MSTDQIFMGAAVVIVCATGLYNDRWFIQNTRKGRRLVGWFGETGSIWVLRGLLIGGAVFGALLAAGFVNPVRW
jgi:hypothetical protein